VEHRRILCGKMQSSILLKMTVQRVTTSLYGVTGKNLHNVKYRRAHI